MNTAQYFEQALDSYKRGQRERAQAICQSIIAKHPEYSDAHHILGVLAYQSGDYAAAVEMIKAAIAIAPTHPAYFSNLGLALQALKQTRSAIDSYDLAIGLRPDYPEALSNRGTALLDAGDPAGAVESLDRAIALRPDYAEAYYNRGNALAALGEPSAAIRDFDRAIVLRPTYAAAFSNRGDVLQRINQYEAALASYDRAVEIEPRAAEIWSNRGAAFHELARYQDAINSYDRAVTLDAGYAPAYSNRASARFELRDFANAVGDCDKAIQLQPDHAEAFSIRAKALRELGRVDAASADYGKAVSLQPDNIGAKKDLLWHHLTASENISAAEKSALDLAELYGRKERGELAVAKTIAAFRLQHDLEQTTYLLAQGYAVPGLQEAHATLGDICRRMPSTGGHAANKIALLDEEVTALNRFRQNVFRCDVALEIDAFLNPENDWRAIEAQYLSTNPEIIYIDEFLSPACLRALQKFCLVSTVWTLEYENQYLGAFADRGFVSSLHVEIASELRQRMPRIFEPHRLEQLWAFKYASDGGKGINIHADFARVNLNFWITPDDANLDPSTGGMIIHDVPSPPTWGFEEYNMDRLSIRAFLEKNGSGQRRIPYRCNRAVLFNSALFHETDLISFKSGYENRRINVTYLFGRGLSPR